MRVLITGAAGFIGSHVRQALFDKEYDFISIDRVVQPGVRRCDVTKFSELLAVFQETAPTHVLNLAGDTDLSIRSLNGYQTNIVGTQNVVNACLAAPQFKRLVHVSTQHVCRTPAPPQSDLHFAPDTLYATSKVLSELLVRQLCDREWVIARPTNIWGPGHPILTPGFWRQLAKGRYVHPAGDNVVRGYGFVRNAAAQLIDLLTSNAALNRVVYVTDELMRQADWVDAFAIGLTGKRARRAPRSLVAALAAAGELLRRCGLPAALYWSRYQSMTRSQRIPFDETTSILGRPEIPFDVGVEQTVSWLTSQHIDGSGAHPRRSR
jgi:GlcNAc-P-P-Und epimerase